MPIFTPTPSRFDCRFSHFTPSRFVNVHHLFLTILSLHHQGLSNWISESSRPYPYTHLFNAPILRVPLLEHPFVQFSVENSIFVTRFSPIYRIHPFKPTNILLIPSSQQNVWRAERARHLGGNLQTFSVGSFSNQRHPQLNWCEALLRRNRTWKMKTQLQTWL